MGGDPINRIDKDGRIAPMVIVAAMAVAGAYSGGTIANNGQMNPTKWDYNSAKTWGYMLGGAIAGGASAGLAGAVAASGIPFANTAAIATGSFANSIMTTIYTGGRTDVSIGLGFASYNFNSGELGYLGKEGNSAIENIGYGLGGLGNLADVAPYVDKITHWENKIAAQANEGVEYYESKGHIRENLNPSTEGINLGKASYPGGNNPRLLDGKYYYGKVKNWGYREYAGYLHDLAYERAGVTKGFNMFVYGKRLIGADFQFAGRQIFLSLKYNYGVGFLIGTVSGINFAAKPIFPFGYGL
jgi:hypothetical protein